MFSDDSSSRSFLNVWKYWQSNLEYSKVSNEYLYVYIGSRELVLRPQPFCRHAVALGK